MPARALTFVLALFGGLPAQAQAQPTAGFDGLVAQQIQAVASFRPPEFALGRGRDGPFTFYGASMNEQAAVTCERQASFGLVARANMAGGILAGVCEREVQRVRTLAAAAQPRFAGVVALLREGAASFDAAAAEKAGWKYTKSTGADGAEEHYFPMIIVGHGIASLATLVRVSPDARRATIVQADLVRLCENYGLKEQTRLCSAQRESLAEIARGLEAAARRP